MNFAKFLRTHFLTEHLRWLFLSLAGGTRMKRVEEQLEEQGRGPAGGTR